MRPCRLSFSSAINASRRRRNWRPSSARCRRSWSRPMSEISFTTALGRLLADRALRELFTRDRGECMRRLSIDANDAPIFMALDAAQLQAQADTLAQKRLHEVRRLLPMTFARLEDAAAGVFDAYAQDVWPEGHTRYVE